MSYSVLVYLVKIECVPKSTIFGLTMMLKSGLDIFILKLLHAGNYFPCVIKGKIFAPNYKFSNKMKHSRPLSPSTKNFNFRYLLHFDQVNDAWITHILCVKCKCPPDFMQKATALMIKEYVGIYLQKLKRPRKPWNYLVKRMFENTLIFWGTSCFQICNLYSWQVWTWEQF